MVAPALPHLRRASDFGSPGVAVAAPSASRASTMSARAQDDDAMEMLLQVPHACHAVPVLNVVQFLPYRPLFCCRSSQALQSTRMPGWMLFASSYRCRLTGNPRPPSAALQCRLQALQQSFAAFAAQFNEWRQRAFLQCKAVFERATAESAHVDFDDTQGFLRQALAFTALAAFHFTALAAFNFIALAAFNFTALAAFNSWQVVGRHHAGYAVRVCRVVSGRSGSEAVVNEIMKQRSGCKCCWKAGTLSWSSASVVVMT